ncbi:unnamed protein product, partial [Choristocarpus tenellus]
EPISKEQAVRARVLVFNNPLATFNSAWLQQGFFFSEHKRLGYGLVQTEGGPCGVLAVVQAFLLQHLLFGQNACDWRSLSRVLQEQALVVVLTQIIWQAGNRNEAILTLVRGEPSIQRSSQYKADTVTERLKL